MLRTHRWNRMRTVELAGYLRFTFKKSASVRKYERNIKAARQAEATHKARKAKARGR